LSWTIFVSFIHRDNSCTTVVKHMSGKSTTADCLEQTSLAMMPLCYTCS